MICTPHPILYNDEIENNEMGEACSADGEERGVFTILVGNMRERDQWRDPDLDGSIILRWI
jgi:hypothetical protein